MRELSLLVSADQGLVCLRLPKKRRLTLGRGPDCDVVLDDDSVSRTHARLSVGVQVSIEDLKSSNGTLVLGRRLAPGEKAPLPLGAIFDLAGTTLVVHDRSKLPLPAKRRPRSKKAAPLIVDPAMQRLAALIDVIARTDLDVLIAGEAGSGKRMFSRVLVTGSPRAKKPILLVDSGTLDLPTLASAVKEARDGTIIFERVDELPASLRAKVFGVRRLKARRVFTTEADETRLARSLGGFSVVIPPLRTRREDILPLARLFAERSAKQLDEPVPGLSEQAANALTRHDWPRNVRELQGVMDRAVLGANGAKWIDLEHLRLPRYER